MNRFVFVRQGAYNPDYLKVLCAQVRAHHGTEPVCLTDNPTGYCEERPLRYTLPGWWSKLELFAPENQDLRPSIYLDLDSFIMEDIRDVAPSGKFAMCREWLTEPVSWSQSSMMFLPAEPDAARCIWDSFMHDPTGNMSDIRGDQIFLSRFGHDRVQDIYPDLIGSYTRHKQQLERKTRIVTFHGALKQERTEGWAHGEWRRYVST